ncbi:MAG: NADAR family protein [Candidatus Spechtbacterales bacterium]|nr:NADAR family protein [Candidatus Spechtbacterales bacterium]
MHKLDNEKQIFFYEQEFYVFSNFSSFKLNWKGYDWMTSEHAYHSEKFDDPKLIEGLKNCRSAHDSMKLAYANKDKYRKDWDDIKLDIMKKILHAKVQQHPYVKKKLLESGDKELIEDSWRDDYWGWGPNKDGANHLGKLWMEVREEIQTNEDK